MAAEKPMSPVAEQHHAVGQLQALQHLFGVGDHRLQLVHRRLGRRQLHQLDLVELVLADEAAHVLAVGAGLGAEAGREGDVLPRQVGRLQHLVAVQVRERHLRGRDQVEVAVARARLEEVALELGELARCRAASRRSRGTAGSPRGSRARRVCRSSMKATSARSRRAPVVPQHREARARDLGRALEVEDAELRPELPVRLRARSRTRAASPTRRTSTFAATSPPTGTLSSGRLGTTRRLFCSASSVVGEAGLQRLDARPPRPSSRPCSADVSSCALPRRAISSPTTRWRWRSRSTC